MKKNVLFLSLILGINFLFGQVQTDCSRSDGTFSYYVELIIDTIPNSFDKNDFINHIVGLDNISNEYLTTLNQDILTVYKSFPTAQTPILQKVITVDTTTEIYQILADLNNSIENQECRPEGMPLGLKLNEQRTKIIVFPNPISDNSIIDIKLNSSDIKLEIINSLGQIIYQEKTSGNKTIEFNKIKLDKGIYYVRIFDISNRITKILKIIK